MRLNELADNQGARKPRKRVGRGVGSGTGKTAGRGVKGQKSRSGVAINGFEGGQMPLHMRLPKRGFNKPNRLKFAEVNLGRLQEAIDAKKLDAGSKIDAAALIEAGVIKKAHDGIRLLGRGELTAKETKQLTKQQAKIRKMERRAKNDGVVTKKERVRLHKAQNKASRSIKYKRNN